MYRDIPNIQSYVRKSITLCFLAFIFPFLFPIDFGTEILTWQKRLGQSGILLTYSSALFGAMSLFWSSTISNNLLLANNNHAHYSRWLNILQNLNKKYGTHINGIKETEEIITEAARQIEINNSFPQIISTAGRISIALIIIGTIFQLIAT